MAAAPQPTRRAGRGRAQAYLGQLLPLPKRLAIETHWAENECATQRGQNLLRKAGVDRLKGLTAL